MLHGDDCRGAPIYDLTQRDRVPEPRLVNATAVSLHFFSDHARGDSGFRFVFSFHNRSAKPDRLSDGTWNCSVAHWPDFRLHFPCDLQAECDGGEDEAGCAYTTPTCGPGRIGLNGSCYVYVTPSRDVSWNEAATICKSEGARLASLNSPEEWIAVRELLRLSNFDYVFTGLRAKRGNLPAM